MPLKFNAGDTFPEFSLPDEKGQATSLGSLLEKGPLLLVFYRGPW
jgi:peroxiredoxin